MHTKLVWVLVMQSYLSSMLPRWSHSLKMTQCLITNIWSCLLEGRMPSIPLAFKHWFLRHFGDIFIFCVTTLVYQTTEDCAESDASEERLHRCICLSAAFQRYSRQVLWIMWLVLLSFHQTPQFSWDCSGAGRSSEVERSLMVRWVVQSILHGVDPLSYFSFQPVLHDWCNKGCGMCYPVCGMVHIKEPLLLIDKSSLCGGRGFPFWLSEWSLTIYLTPYNRR